jgi:hypothetical protein
MQKGMTTVGVMVSGAMAIALTLPAGVARSEEPARPNLTGRWQLNKELSEDARAKIAEARERSGRAGGGGMGGRPGGGGMGGGGGGMGGGWPGGMGGRPGGGMGGGRPGGTGGGQRPEGAGPMRMRALLDPPQILLITGNDAELTLDGGDGVLVRLHIDGRRYKAEGGSVETKAEWKGAKLLVETKPTEGGFKTTTTYSLDPAAGRLQIVTRIEGPMGDPISVKRVYDPAPAE